MRRGDGVTENITKWSWRGGCGEKSRLIRKNSGISAFVYLCRNSAVLVDRASMETGSGKWRRPGETGSLRVPDICCLPLEKRKTKETAAGSGCQKQ